MNGADLFVVMIVVMMGMVVVVMMPMPLFGDGDGDIRLSKKTKGLEDLFLLLPLNPWGLLRKAPRN